MRFFVSKFLMFLLFLLMLIQPVQASGHPKIVDDFEVCTIAAQQMEEKYQIKKHLLSTITNVETGRWNKKLQRTMAWPWTVNALGKGYFFETKQQAIAEVKRLQSEGVRSIDVGCMQINLSYHPDAFRNLEEAFNPYKNMEYGAKFLTKLYEQKGNDWNKAATAYHSSLPEKAQVYAMKLSKAYKGVVEYANLDPKPSVKPVVKPIVIAKKTKPLEKTKLVIKSKKNHRSTAAEKANAWRENKLKIYYARKQNSFKSFQIADNRILNQYKIEPRAMSSP